MTRRLSVSSKEVVAALIKKELVESTGLKRPRISTCTRCNKLLKVSKTGRVVRLCRPCRTKDADERQRKKILLYAESTNLDRARREPELIGPADFGLWMKWLEECRERQGLLSEVGSTQT